MIAPATDIPRDVALGAVDRHLAQLAGDGDEAELQTWLAADELHRRAWRHIQAINLTLDSQLSTAAQQALLSPGKEQRRRAIKALALLLFAGGLGGIGYQAPWREALADIRTAAGQRHSLTLPGGHQLELNTASVINLQKTASGLQIHLLQGELLLDSTSKIHTQQPTVLTADGSLHPQHARFAVRQTHGRSQVDVLQGSVAVVPAAASTRVGTLQAGESAHFNRHRLSAPQPTDAQRFAWTDGMLVASNLPLGELIEDLARYRPGYLGCDPELAQLRLSGTYPLADTDRILASLTRTLPVRLRTLSRYWVRVIPA